MKINKPMSLITLGIILTAAGAIFTGIGTVISKNEEIKFQEQLINEQKRNQELSDELLKTTNEIVKPELNVIVGKEFGKGENLGAEIVVNNTGGSTCKNVKLVLEKHPSPLKNMYLESKFEISPKSQSIRFIVPFFKDPRHPDYPLEKELEEKYYDYFNSYNDDKKAIIINFHIEYEWKDSSFISKSYILTKAKVWPGIDIRLLD